MKHKMFLTVAALVLLFLSAFKTEAQIGFSELDPNILWVADSAIGRIDGFAVHPNGNIFAYEGSTIYEIDGNTGKLIKVLQITIDAVEFSSFDISSDGNHLAVSWNKVVIIDLNNYNQTTINRAALVCFVPNSNKIAYAAISTPPGNKGHDSSIVILDLENGLRKYIKTEEMITKIAFSPDGRFLATGGSGQDVFGKSYVSLKLWDANTLELIKELDRIENSTISASKIKYSDDNKLVGFWRSWANLKIFNTETMSLFKDYNQKNTNLEISDFAFISDDYIGVQSKNTSLIRLSDNYILNLIDFPQRGFMESNKENDILFAGTGDPNRGGSIIAWDLNKIFSSVENESGNTTIQASYQKGTLTISGMESVGNKVNIEIFDINGKIIRQLKSQTIGSEMRVPLILPRGTYLLNITDGQNQYSSKFLVTE